MAEGGNRSLAEVKVSKLKECPMLTTGRITPLIIQQWGSACTRFQKMSGTADDKVVSFVADAMMEPRLVSWYTSDRVRIDALTLKEYLKELSDLTLEKNWAHLIRQQILSAKQPDKTCFIDWKIELENLNALLVTSSPTHALSASQLQDQLEANTRAKLNLSLENEPINSQPFSTWARDVNTRDDTLRVLERDIDERMAARKPLAQRLTDPATTSSAFPSSQSLPHRFLPKLEDSEKKLLMEHEGCNRCQCFYAGHRTEACPMKASNTWPDPSRYTTLTLAMALAAKPKARLAAGYVGTHDTSDEYYDDDTYVSKSIDSPFTVPHLFAPVQLFGPPFPIFLSMFVPCLTLVAPLQ